MPLPIGPLTRLRLPLVFRPSLAGQVPSWRLLAIILPEVLLLPPLARWPEIPLNPAACGTGLVANDMAADGTLGCIPLPLPTGVQIGGVLTGGNCNGTTGKQIGTGADGLPVCGTDQTGATAMGTGVETFLGTPTSANFAAAITNETGTGVVVLATSPTLVTPALGTPSAVVLTSGTGLPISTGVSGLGTGVATFLGTPTSANFAAAITNETGTGAAVFGTSPTLTTPTISGQLLVDASGIEYTESDTNPTCAAGNYAIYADLSETKFKKCTNGTATDLDTGGGGSGSVIASADCSLEVLDPLEMCIQEGVDPAPDLLFFCGLAAGCSAGAATNLPPFDTDTGVLNLQEAWTGGKQIMGVDSLENALVLCVDLTDPADGDCSDAEDMSMSAYCDLATGCQWVTKPDGNMNLHAPTGFDINLMLGAVTHVKLNNVTGKLDFLNDGQPLKSVEVTGYEVGSCTYAEATIVAGRPKIGAFTCTDADADGFDFDFLMPLKWDAGTVMVQLKALSVDATPTGNLVMSCSGQAIGDGETIAAKGTSLEQNVTINFTGGVQYREEQGTSAAITLSGVSTFNGGDHIYMHCDIDATLSTVNTEISAVRINAAAKVFYTVTSTSE
jgi:hypothetical protein